MRSRVAVTAAIADVVGSALVLILLAVHWQTVQIARPAPFGTVTAALTGRTLQPAAFGLALVTLAGTVAALATRGVARRIVGVLVAAAGVGAAVTAGLGVSAVGDERARSLVARTIAGASTGGNAVPLDDGTVVVTTHAVWPVLTAVAAVLTVAAGMLWLLAPAAATRRGGLGARYEAPRATQPARDATWWSALDHGDDPTAPTDDASTGDDPSTGGGPRHGDDPSTGGDPGDRGRTATEHDPDANPVRRTS